MTITARGVWSISLALWTVIAALAQGQPAEPTSMPGGEKRGGYFPAQLTKLNRDGTVQSTVGLPDEYGEPSLSPDGARVASTLRGLICIHDLRKGTRIEVRTIPEALSRHLAWSPDGKRIAFVGDESGRLGLYSTGADGSGPAKLLYQAGAGEALFITDWSDERFLLYQSRGAISMLVVGQGKSVLLVKGPFVANHGKLSPDRRYLAYWSNESGQGTVLLRPFDPALPGVPPDGRTLRVSGPGAASPLAWGRDGRELYYRDASSAVMAVEIDSAAPVRVRPPQALFKPQGMTLAGGSISHDGAVFLFNVRVAPARKVIDIDTNTLQRYVGQYVMSEGSELLVSLESGQLSIQHISSAGEEPKQLLLAVGRNRFFVRLADRDIEYEFQTDEQGAVARVHAFFGATRESGVRK